MVNVFFSGAVRGRQLDTIRNLPKGVVALNRIAAEAPNPLPSKHGSLKQAALSVSRSLGLPTINAKKVKVPAGTDIVYSFGAVLRNNIPYIVEIDNVSCLTWYNPRALTNPVTRAVIKRFLKSPLCKRIVCISDASKKSVINTFHDKGIEEKITVVYPLARQNNFKKSDSGKTRILYVSNQFYLKGGKEILLAFDALSKKYKNIELVMVSRYPKAVLDKYAGREDIRLMDADKTREELARDFYSKSDIFVLLSYIDSFGMVMLEALAAGMPIIATDMFAIPEMVEDRRNGFLIKSPLKCFNDDFTPNAKYYSMDVDEYARTHDFGGIASELEKKLGQLVTDEELRKRMAEQSSLLFREKFSEEKRMESLKQVFGV